MANVLPREKQTRPKGSANRIPAHEIEVAVVQALRTETGLRTDEIGATDDAAVVADHLQRVVISDTSLELTISAQDKCELPSTVFVPYSVPNAKPAKRQIPPEESVPNLHMRASKRRRLLLGIAKARAWYDDLVTGRVASVREIAIREKTTHRHVRLMLPLAFLPPSFIVAAINNSLNSHMGLSSVSKRPPLVWRREGNP
jgi:site-specific DNA recombinase